MRRPLLHPLSWGVLLGALVGLSGCGSLRYYAHVAHGQGALLAERRSIAKLVADPSTDAKLASRLRLALAAREFAWRDLDLPRNRSYTYYVALSRPYVVWNVFAAPLYSLSPVTHCFPIAGCVAYRGYFDRGMAEAEAKSLAAHGNEVYVGGVPAYSTLGWFADPILSSMLRWDDDELAGTIFHELAHQKLYVKGDTAFNESFASFVQAEGLRQWRRSRELPPAASDRDAREKAFVAMVLDLRERLRTLYASGIDAQAMETGKAREIAGFRRRFAVMRDRSWHGDHRYDGWVDGTINNAALLPFGLYEQWVPAFAALYAQTGDAWPVFFAQVRKLAWLDVPARDAALRKLMPAAVPPPTDLDSAR
jgi:predicted aminopeptidase